MATLETIPEETTATPTPARVTADPPKTKPDKNPNRVAAGKRIAERNRRVRDVLDQMKQEEAEAASVTDSKSDTTAKGSGLSLVAVLGIGGLIVSLISVYYQREAIMARFKHAPPPPPPAEQAQPAEPAPVKQSLKKMV